jgi:predicted nucleic acid-binding protein
MSDRLRVVIDTNLVLSALVFGGSTARLRLAWQSDRFVPLASKATITELIIGVWKKLKQKMDERHIKRCPNIGHEKSKH